MSSDSDLLDPDFNHVGEEAFGDIAPWNPSSIIYNAFLGGPLPAGLLFALNTKRLGRPAAFAPSLAIAFLAGLGLPTLVLLYLQSSGPIARRDAQFGIQILGLLLGFGWAPFQRPRFEAYSREGLVAASLWKPGFIAILASLAIQAAWAMVLTPWIEFEFEDG